MVSNQLAQQRSLEIEAACAHDGLARLQTGLDLNQIARLQSQLNILAAEPRRRFANEDCRLPVDLLHRIHEMVFDRVMRLDLRLPMNRLDLLALAHQEGKVLHEEFGPDAAVVQCVVPKRLMSRFEAFVTGKSAARNV